MERVVLIGFMGSGKSTLGRLLASRADLAFVDLDAEVETRAGRPIATLFQEQGEPGFRGLELETLRQLLVSAPQRCVVAAGGGIVETPAAAPILRQFGRVVWLRADPEVCVARLGAARSERPLLGPGADWRARWVRREPLYRSLAAAVVSTHPEGVEESLARLIEVAAPAPEH